ncbi:MAG TPA: tRNA pseudouridine(38-40) synthase TruA [Vicinamibacterales bacterium]
MPRFRLLLEYAGTRYSGWQIQKNARTVQGELDRAVREVTGERGFELYGSGRTDAGVHALGQVAHLDVRTSLPPATLVRRLNEALPADINVLRAEKVPHRFHARHDAISRTYIYQIARRRTAFAKPFVWWVREPLDMEAMRAAARGFQGRLDFRGFTDDDPGEKSTIVEVDALRLESRGDALLVVVEGSHFLWKMVRRIVGVLVAIGRGELEPDAVPRLLAAPDGLPAKLTAPASGLFLARVMYPGDPSSPLPLPPGPDAGALP